MFKYTVPSILAKKLKEIGFDEPTIYQYLKSDDSNDQDFVLFKDPDGFDLHAFIDKGYLTELDFNKIKENEMFETFSAPSYDEVFGWFRTKGLNVTIGVSDDYLKVWSSQVQGTTAIIDIEYGKSYEEVREKALKKLIDVYENISNYNF